MNFLKRSTVESRKSTVKTFSILAENCKLSTVDCKLLHGIESEALLILLDKEGICASSGSACLADSDEPSHVIKAMKPDSTGSREMIRFSLDAIHGDFFLMPLAIPEDK